jgi:tubby-related protein 4
VSPIHINTGMNGLLGFAMEWSNSRELLAVAGTEQDSLGLPNHRNLLKFYTETGALLYTILIPNNTVSRVVSIGRRVIIYFLFSFQNPVSALTWGHNDKRLFIATGQFVHIAWVSRKVASLQLFCRLQIQSSLISEAMLPKLPLPSRIKSLIGNLFAQTIRVSII